ncbi:MAG: methionine ABC transporter permease [Clostridium sp.]
MSEVILKALGETLVMVFFSTLFSVIIGFILAIIVTVTSPNGLKPVKTVYKILDVVINILRGFPFIILMVSIIPFTKIVAGTFIGIKGAIVPLTIAAIPFVARVIEGSLKEVDPGVIEAAKAFGASNIQIIFKVMVKEAIPSIVSGITLIVISIMGYSAMAGAVGGGGLGNLAITYGFQRYQTDIMMITVIILIIMVQVLQSLGNYVYKKLS